MMMNSNFINGIVFFAIAAASVSCLSKDEIKDKAEAESKFLVEKESRIVKGIGEALKGDGKDAAASVSEGIGEVFKGASEGFDESLTKVSVVLKDSLANYAELGRTGKHTCDSTKETSVSVYMIFNKEFEGKVLLKAYDGDNVELGRKSVQLKMSEDSAAYVDFKFDDHVPVDLAQHFELDKK